MSGRDWAGVWARFLPYCVVCRPFPASLRPNGWNESFSTNAAALSAGSVRIGTRGWADIRSALRFDALREGGWVSVLSAV